MYTYTYTHIIIYVYIYLALRPTRSQSKRPRDTGCDLQPPRGSVNAFGSEEEDSFALRLRLAPWRGARLHPTSFCVAPCGMPRCDEISKVAPPFVEALPPFLEALPPFLNASTAACGTRASILQCHSLTRTLRSVYTCMYL